ncbi:BnaAnng24380D [Brassica napus]|uniref:BnaAnng24380D protein n=1 Tax=Brassica napus TaxID=3708 RepID=A0A078JQ26_BRANA|nr:BnaAnng24380D [Brassica napus]
MGERKVLNNKRRFDLCFRFVFGATHVVITCRKALNSIAVKNKS